jgi:hypothetical protein
MPMMQMITRPAQGEALRIVESHCPETQGCALRRPRISKRAYSSEPEGRGFSP